MLKYMLVPLCLVAFSLQPVLGQNTTSTTSEEAVSAKERRAAKRAEEAKKKPDYDPSIVGHAYFLTDGWVLGDVWYSGATIEKTPLRYDLVRDELTLPPLEPDAPAHKFRLISEKVDSFDISGHTFIRIEDTKGMKDGFYDRLYKGKVQVLAKRQKYIFTETTYQKVTQRMLTEDRYYLFKDRKYHPVKNKAGVLKVFKDKKKYLNKFMEREQLNFKENIDQDLAKVAAYYDSLRN